ncbi:MAG: Ornithine decarboxylase [Thelocarpon impressellum]|nr:MAG: Ornithine decarboxylase [Thelocarpon impressellum]
MAPSAIADTQTYTPVTLSRAKSVTSKATNGEENINSHQTPGGKPAGQLVGDALRERVESIDHELCEPGDEDAFFVADLGEVYRQHLRWKLNLKRVKPFYAVKCNPDAQVLRLLAGLGTGFDCASKHEIQQVLDLGLHPSRVIYANPCKTNSHIRYAAQEGVKQMTFDNTVELRKIKRFFPGAELFLRISTDDSLSVCRLSMKFGAAMEATQELLELAKELELNVAGVSFHVGSGATDPQVFVKAVRDARTVFDRAAALGFNIRTLDVGGGFCSDTFETMAGVLSEALEDYIPPHIRVIGEPGRYYVARAFTLACNVIARRNIEDAAAGETSYMIYLNDGMYGNFSCIMFDHQNPVPRVLRRGQRFLHGRDADSPAGYGTEYSIWGPTCDGIDCVSPRCTLPEVLEVGDWLYFDEMGAYTKCSATRFNGFTDDHDVVYVCSEPGASALLSVG